MQFHLNWNKEDLRNGGRLKITHLRAFPWSWLDTWWSIRVLGKYKRRSTLLLITTGSSGKHLLACLPGGHLAQRSQFSKGLFLESQNTRKIGDSTPVPLMRKLKSKWNGTCPSSPRPWYHVGNCFLPSNPYFLEVLRCQATNSLCILDLSRWVLLSSGSTISGLVYILCAWQ
jgi:hypothetical protein